MGTRLRLKSTKDLAAFAEPLRRIFRAMQTHGPIVADNGSDTFISVTMDARWNNDELNPAFRSLNADEFGSSNWVGAPPPAGSSVRPGSHSLEEPSAT
jgi:hypothetical protein